MLYINSDLFMNLNQFNNDEIDRFAETILAAMLRYDHFYCAMNLWILRDHEEKFNALLHQQLFYNMANALNIKNIKRNESSLVSIVIKTMPQRLDTSWYMVDMLDDVQNGLLLLYIEMKILLSGYIYAAYLKNADKQENWLSKSVKYPLALSAIMMTKSKGRGYVRLAETFLRLLQCSDKFRLMNMRHRFEF